VYFVAKLKNQGNTTLENCQVSWRLPNFLKNIQIRIWVGTKHDRETAKLYQNKIYTHRIKTLKPGETCHFEAKCTTMLPPGKKMAREMAKLTVSSNSDQFEKIVRTESITLIKAREKHPAYYFRVGSRVNPKNGNPEIVAYIGNEGEVNTPYLKVTLVGYKKPFKFNHPIKPKTQEGVLFPWQPKAKLLLHNNNNKLLSSWEGYVPNPQKPEEEEEEEEPEEEEEEEE
jgi:hypothetical protein